MLLTLGISVLIMLVWSRVLYLLWRDKLKPARSMIVVSVVFVGLIVLTWNPPSVDLNLNGSPETVTVQRTPGPTPQPEPAETPTPEPEAVGGSPQPCQIVQGKAVLSGSRQAGPNASDPVSFRVSGKRIGHVTFFADGRQRKVDKQRPFVYKMRASSLKTKRGRKYGKHVVKAKVKFVKCTRPKDGRTLRIKVNRRKPAPPKPPAAPRAPSTPVYTPAPTVPAPSTPAPSTPAPAPTQPPSSGGQRGPQPDPAPTGGTGPRPDPYPGGGGTPAPWDTGD